MERIPASQGDAEILDEIWNELFLQLARFEELRVVRAVSSLGTQGYRVRSEARLTSGRIRALILLEDAETGAVIWTEQVDHQAAGRETMAESVIIPLAHHIAHHATSETRQRARHKSPLALSARELYLLATDHHHRGTEADTATAHSLLERAIAIDPNYAPAYAWLGYAVQRGLIYGWGADKGEAAREKALALTRHSTLLAPDSPICLARLALCLNLSRQFGEAVATARLALSGTWIPSIDDCVTCSEILAQNGHAEEAIEVMQRILRFDSYALPTTRSVLGRALLMAGRPQEALPELRICAARLPDYLACHHSILMAAHETGQTDEACRAFENIQRLQPGWKPTESGGPWMFRNAADFERLQVAFDAAQAALQPQQHPTTGEVLSFRLRDGTGRS
jgi:tetratricopeptide (TPR) repeat protein